MRCLWLSPDGAKSPVGGLGVHIRSMLDIIAADVKLISPDDFVLSLPVGTQDGFSATFLRQANYVISGTGYRPDIVHSYDWSTAWAGILLAQHFGVPLVFSVHLDVGQGQNGVHPAQRLQYNYAVAMEFAAMAAASRVLFVSEASASRYRLFAPKSALVPNGINLQEWSGGGNSDTRLPGDPRSKKLVFVGRFSEMKNIQVLVECSLPDGVELIVVGGSSGGSYEVAMRVQESARLNPRVHLVGELYGQKKIDVMRAADGIIMPSTHEPFGIVALEAMAARKPLLCSRADGLGEFVNDSNSIYCGTTKESIEEAMRVFLALREDERNRLIDGGIATAQRYTWKEQADKLMAVYEFVLHQYHKEAVQCSSM